MTETRRNKFSATVALLLSILCLEGCQSLGADSGDSVAAAQLFAESQCPISLEPPYPAISIFANTEDLGVKRWASALRDTDADSPDTTLILAHIGPKPTPGYGIELQAAAVSGSKLLLKVIQATPDPDKMYAQMMTAPCILVRVPARPYSDILLIDIEPAGE